MQSKDFTQSRRFVVDCCIVHYGCYPASGDGMPMHICLNCIPEYNLCFSGGEIDSVDKDGNTPLHIAAYYGHEHLISTLIASGADCTKLACLPLCKNALTETTIWCKVDNAV